MGADAQFGSGERYKVIPRVLVFPVSADGKVLLLQGAQDKKIWAGLWNGIGGHVEAGESVLAAAKRELLEESNLRAGAWLYCGQVMVDTAEELGIAFFVFKAMMIEGMLQESSEGALQWLLPAEIEALSLVEDLYYLVPRVLRFIHGDSPFWALYQYDRAGQLVMQFSG